MDRPSRVLIAALFLAAMILLAAGAEDEKHRETAADEDLVEVEIKARGGYVMYVIMDAEMEKNITKPQISNGVDKIVTRTYRRKQCCGFHCKYADDNVTKKWVERNVIELGIGQSGKLLLRKNHGIEVQAVAGEFKNVKITKAGTIKCGGMTCKVNCEYE